jgi:hypothetical protein
MGTALQVINDMVELQNGKLTFSDTPHGKIFFRIKMYGNKWEFQFTVEETGENRCAVKIAIEQAAQGDEEMLRREFALLDSLLAGEKP